MISVCGMKLFMKFIVESTALIFKMRSMRTVRTGFIVAAVLGFSGVAMGAFGAHALKPMLMETGRYALWETAVQYHLLHAVALLTAAVWRVQRCEKLAFGLLEIFWALGVAFFSGSLYLMATGAPRELGALTPVGGVLLLLGWIIIGVIAMRDDQQGEHGLQ